MKGINRRRFLQIAGAGSIAATATGAATVLPKLQGASRLTASSKNGMVTFRAVTGLPSKPLPSYSSLLIEGHVDLNIRTGIVTKTILAGNPQAMSTVALPGLSRIIRVTDVQDLGGTFRIQGVVDDRSQLLRGENSTFDILIDPIQRLASTNSFGSKLV